MLSQVTAVASPGQPAVLRSLGYLVVQNWPSSQVKNQHSKSESKNWKQKGSRRKIRKGPRPWVLLMFWMILQLPRDCPQNHRLVLSGHLRWNPPTADFDLRRHQKRRLLQLLCFGNHIPCSKIQCYITVHLFFRRIVTSCFFPKSAWIWMVKLAF